MAEQTAPSGKAAELSLCPDLPMLKKRCAQLQLLLSNTVSSKE